MHHVPTLSPRALPPFHLQPENERMTDCVAEQESFSGSGPTLPILLILGNPPRLCKQLPVQQPRWTGLISRCKLSALIYHSGNRNVLPNWRLLYCNRLLYAVRKHSPRHTGVAAGAATGQGLFQRACIGTNTAPTVPILGLLSCGSNYMLFSLCSCAKSLDEKAIIKVNLTPFQHYLPILQR
jgi:hypothetical protein